MVGGIDRQLRAGRRFVGRGDAGELLDLAGAGPLVQALGVAPLAGLEIGLDVDLVKSAPGRAPGPVAVGLIGRDERGDADEAGIGEQRRHLADAADVLGPVVGRKAEVGVQAPAHVVAVQHVDVIALLEQALLHLHGQRRLAGPGQAGEPEHPAPVAVALGAAAGRDSVLDARHVGGLDLKGLALVGIALHRDHAAGHGVVTVDQDTAPAARDAAMLVESEHPAAAQHHLGHGVAFDPVARTPGQGVGIDDPFDRLDRDRALPGGELELVCLAHLERRPAEPEQGGAEHRGQLRRMVLVAGDLATLDEKLLVEGHADRLAGVRLDGQRIDVPRLDRTDPRDLVGRREQQAVADAQHAGFDPAGENPPGIELVDVLDWEAQRLVRRHG